MGQHAYISYTKSTDYSYMFYKQLLPNPTVLTNCEWIYLYRGNQGLLRIASLLFLQQRKQYNHQSKALNVQQGNIYIYILYIYIYILKPNKHNSTYKIRSHSLSPPHCTSCTLHFHRIFFHFSYFSNNPTFDS